MGQHNAELATKSKTTQDEYGTGPCSNQQSPIQVAQIN